MEVVWRHLVLPRPPIRIRGGDFMSYELEAIYENGTLRLDRLLPFEEHQRVKVVVEEEPTTASPVEKDPAWWAALQDVLADQKKRGFIGTTADIDRSDESYEYSR
jgi:predicted DNA-binding antitoxin AbrB/MazE fold protein